MFAYAANRPVAGERRSSPNAMLADHRRPCRAARRGDEREDGAAAGIDRRPADHHHRSRSDPPPPPTADRAADARRSPAPTRDRPARRAAAADADEPVARRRSAGSPIRARSRADARCRSRRHRRSPAPVRHEPQLADAAVRAASRPIPHRSSLSEEEATLQLRLTIDEQRTGRRGRSGRPRRPRLPRRGAPLPDRPLALSAGDRGRPRRSPSSTVITPALPARRLSRGRAGGGARSPIFARMSWFPTPVEPARRVSRSRAPSCASASREQVIGAALAFLVTRSSSSISWSIAKIGHRAAAAGRSTSSSIRRTAPTPRSSPTRRRTRRRTSAPPRKKSNGNSRSSRTSSGCEPSADRRFMDEALRARRGGARPQRAQPQCRLRDRLARRPDRRPRRDRAGRAAARRGGRARAGRQARERARRSM